MTADNDFRHSRVQVGGSSLHVVEAGDPVAPPVVLVHGWPQSWAAWRGVMAEGADQARVIAFDLPGVGESTGDPTDGSKQELAAVVHGLVGELGLERPVLAGHDCGGMVAWSYAKAYDDVSRVAILDTVIPGIDPWSAVIANPYVWHFAFHSIPRLPETLVAGRQRAYFDYFFDVLSPDPERITEQARAAAVAAYGTDSALTAGFSWYRQLSADAKANSADSTAVATPLRYIRGSKEGGDIEAYAAAFRAAGFAAVTTALVEGAGHFTLEEDPAATWQAIIS
jgi:pimeloyl-ACP methyl ester carboxylesterase